MKKFLDKKQDSFFKIYVNADVMDIIIISYWCFDLVKILWY